MLFGIYYPKSHVLQRPGEHCLHGCSNANQDLAIKGLQSWLNHNIMTNLLDEATDQIAQLVVANGGVSFRWARQSM